MRPMSCCIVVCAICATAGCAFTARHDASSPARVKLGYASRDHLYAVQMRDTYPGQRGPSSGLHTFAAQLSGNVCGTDIAYDAKYLGRFMSVTGFATNIHSRGDEMSLVIVNSTTGQRTWVSGQGDSRPVSLEVRDTASNGAGERLIRGTIGETDGGVDPLSVQLLRNPVMHTVDLHLTADSLTGDVGTRRVDLRRANDDLLGYVEIYGHKVPFVVRGAGELWGMPAAAQAAILPLLLTCTTDTKLVQVVDFRN
ncbi:MAG: hypothetical protein JWM53_2170 [bacterium]|nr:hypothetical protein [bacterium]